MKKIGISLIVLIITIIVIIVIATAVILTLSNTNLFTSAKEAKFKNDIATFNDELNMYVVTKYMGQLGEYDRKELYAENIEAAHDNVQPIKEVIPSMTNNDYLNKIKVVEGLLSFSNLTEEEQKWLDELTNINVAGNNTGENEGDIDSIYKQSGVNAPIVPTSNNMYAKEKFEGINAIMFDEYGKKQIVTDLSKEWYKYVAQNGNTVDGGTSNWANIQTKDGSQWVWIPRFAYKITKGAHTKVSYQEYNGLKDGEAGTIEIKFLKGNTNEFWDGSGYAETDSSKITYSEIGVQSDFLVHPGFMFDNIPLTGFWVAKFEASSAQGNGNSLATDNHLNTKTIQSIEGVSSWRYIETKNMFGNCIFMGTDHSDIYGFKKNTNTHLMKNDEWGAVAYLSHSAYGRNGTKMAINNDSTRYITGTGGPLASTTGNYYGVFDMAGGASDAIAAKYTLEKEDFDIFGEHTDVSEYIDTYPSYKNLYKGDAWFETSLKFSTTTSWFSQLSWAVNVAEPFMSRGGSAADGNSAGIFAFYRYKLEWYQLQRIGFRPVITLEKIGNPNIVVN
ncbi:MAG: hypothetical protein PHP54_06010 [Clostridia bacterium]|nr:hypothetical protein [Clostridia bacterium]